MFSNRALYRAGPGKKQITGVWQSEECTTQAGFLEAVNHLQDDEINKPGIFVHPSGVHCHISGFLYFALLMHSELKLLIAQVISESHGYRICSEGNYTGSF